MKVSFLVTYYNQEEYVRQSLESILRIEKPCEWEILVGDDGSSDGTVEVVQEYIQKYPDNIKIFVMPRDMDKKYDSVKRASANRLNILEHATGDFFCTLDGDDYYCDIDFIEEAIEIYQNNMDVSVVAFGYKYVVEGVEGEANTLPAEAGIGRVNKKKYLNSFYLPAGACVHKILWDKERIDYIKTIGYFDDNDIVINSLNYGEMYSINRAIYGYRQTEISVYNSMNFIEQAVLNVQGLDVDFKLIDEKYHKYLLIRNAISIINMYVWKDSLSQILGEDKFNRYKEGCRCIAHSVGYAMMATDCLEMDKKQSKKMVHWVIRKRKKYYLKTKLKYIIRGIIK